MCQIFLKEKSKYAFYFSDIFFFENLSVFEIIWKKNDRDGQAIDNIIRRMRSSCWIHKATNTQSQYVIHIYL